MSNVVFARSQMGLREILMFSQKHTVIGIQRGPSFHSSLFRLLAIDLAGDVRQGRVSGASSRGVGLHLPLWLALSAQFEGMNRSNVEFREKNLFRNT